MANPILTLFDRLPMDGGKKPDKVQDIVHQQSFVGDVSLMIASKGDSDAVEIHVLFGGYLYRFPPTDKNNEAVRMFLGKLGGLG